jgi:hypothetical protein
MSTGHEPERGTGLPDEPGLASSSAPDTTTRSDRRAKRREVRRARRVVLGDTLVRLGATCGVIAIGVAIAAIMVSSNSDGWLVGLVVSIVSSLLTIGVWTARRL